MGFGLAVAAPVGPMSLLCMRRTLAQGWRQGLATGAGIAAGDGVYAGVAVLGLAGLSSFMLAHERPLHLAAGLFLLYLGLRTAFARRPRRPAAPDRRRPGLRERRAADADQPADHRDVRRHLRQPVATAGLRAGAAAATVAASWPGRCCGGAASSPACPPCATRSATGAALDRPGRRRHAGGVRRRGAAPVAVGPRAYFTAAGAGVRRRRRHVRRMRAGSSSRPSSG